MKNLNIALMGLALSASVAASAEATSQTKNVSSSQTNAIPAYAMQSHSMNKKNEMRRQHKKANQSSTPSEENKAKL